MSEILSLFKGKSDFNNELFYYFLPNYNQEKKQIIGQKIIKFKGVIYTLLIQYNIKIQLISFSLKDNINILIENRNNINDEAFQKEILSNGNVEFFEDNKVYEFECTNKNLSKIVSYKCFDIKGKIYFILFIFRILENCE